MAHPSNIYRRSSGIYAVRLAVPVRLRLAVGKGELHLTTGARTLAVAKLVASGLLAHWRDKFLSLDRLLRMDIEQVVLGSPKLTGGGYLRLAEASIASGLEEDSLLREVTEGNLSVFYRAAGIDGYVVPFAALKDDPAAPDDAYDVPPPKYMPELAVQECFVGLLSVRHRRQVASMLLCTKAAQSVLFDIPGRPDVGFAPEIPVALARANIEVAATEVEALRGRTAARLSKHHIIAAKTAGSVRKAAGKSNRRFSEAMEAYMPDRASTCAADHARRIRAACDLFGELEGDPRLSDIDRDRLRDFIAEKLPKVPARENHLRLKFGTLTIAQSMAVAPADWPGLSVEEQQFRVMCLVGLFGWLKNEGWIDEDPAIGLTNVVRGDRLAPKKREQDARDVFSQDELATIFAAPWWASGRGDLTKAGTYREFQPLYYWLPLIGLYTGARINEICQLHLTDVRQSDTGVWFFDVNEDGDSKSLKNKNSKRLVPIHPHLIELGLVKWRDRLQADGFDRLFPELLHHPVKGYSKDAVKWFARFLAGLGFERDATKTYHSFRHGFISHCANKMQIAEAVLAQLIGHKRGDSTLMVTYRKDLVPDDLVTVVRGVEFLLPCIAPFDQDAGAKALADALRRKHLRVEPAK